MDPQELGGKHVGDEMQSLGWNRGDILLVAVKGAVKDAATQTSPTDPPAPRQNSSGGCLQVLKPSDKPISFAQNTPREHILSQLVRDGHGSGLLRTPYEGRPVFA